MPKDPFKTRLEIAKKRVSKRNLSEKKQDHAIQEWLQSLEKNGNIKVIKNGGNN